MTPPSDGTAPPVIALDGPGGVGKSSVGRAVADRLGYYFLSSGLIYRCMGWYLAEQGWDGAASPDLAPLTGFSVRVRDQAAPAVNGRPVPMDSLRADRVSELASRLAELPAVRERANGIQRETVAGISEGSRFGGVVLEGRDIGTVVFPDAPHKFFLTASDEVRAERRYRELKAKDPGVDSAAVLAALRERDHRDATRDVAPLRAADDAITVDTGGRTLEQVVDAIVAAVEQRGKFDPV